MLPLFPVVVKFCSNNSLFTSRTSTGVSFCNFRAEYLKPFFACSVFSLGI